METSPENWNDPAGAGSLRFAAQGMVFLLKMRDRQKSVPHFLLAFSYRRLCLRKARRAPLRRAFFSARAVKKALHLSKIRSRVICTGTTKSTSTISTSQAAKLRPERANTSPKKRMAASSATLMVTSSAIRLASSGRAA